MGTVQHGVEENMKKMEKQLASWGAKIDELTAESKKAGRDARADYRKRIDDLKAKRSAAQRQFDEYRAQARSKATQFSDSMKAAWKEAEKAFKEL